MSSLALSGFQEYLALKRLLRGKTNISFYVAERELIRLEAAKIKRHIDEEIWRIECQRLQEKRS
ncbi:MAG: hypothetical protein DRJ64_04490 [Thermoprotei archaeon]|nr:MAG: hypothetical protein DRJ64_04490 [Thermoprotei archaeon]